MPGRSIFPSIKYSKFLKIDRLIYKVQFTMYNLQCAIFNSSVPLTLYISVSEIANPPLAASLKVILVFLLISVSSMEISSGLFL